MDRKWRMRAAPLAATMTALAILAACGGGGDDGSGGAPSGADGGGTNTGGGTGTGDGGTGGGSGGGTTGAPVLSGSQDAALVGLRERINACLAVPVAQRMEAAACDAVPIADGYLINGRDDAAQYNPLLANPATLNNDIGPIRVERQLDANTAVVVMQWTDSAGYLQQYTDVLRNVAPAGQAADWRLAGNGRRHDFGVRYRIERRPDGAGARRPLRPPCAPPRRAARAAGSCRRWSWAARRGTR